MAEKAKVEKVKTPLFRVSFCHVFKPQAMDDDGTPKYSVVAIFPKGTDLKALKAAAFKAGKEKFGAKWKSVDGKWPDGYRSPFRKTEEKSDTDGYDPGGIFVTFSANVDYPPLVLDKDVTKLDPSDPESKQIFYSGAWAVATVRPYAYENKGNKGVAFGLLGIQKQKDDDRLGGGGGGSTDDFEAVEGAEDNPDNFGSSDENEAGF